jgi:hypothetical protein
MGIKNRVSWVGRNGDKNTYPVNYLSFSSFEKRKKQGDSGSSRNVEKERTRSWT